MGDERRRLKFGEFGGIVGISIVIAKRFALGGGFDFLCEHGDNVLLDSCDGAVKISRSTNNLFVLDD